MKRKTPSLHNIGGMRELARSKGGECLSEVFVSVAKPLLWRCGTCGHEWSVAPKTILYGYHDSWCPACGDRKRRQTQRENRIELLRELARGKGGRLLSEEYVSNGEQLVWECAEKHVWKATARSICQRKTWCRKCLAASKRAAK